MAQPHDELFAKYSIQTKLLTPAQVMSCRDVQAELESAGVTKLLAAVAVDQGALKRADALKLIDAINKKLPGKHPPLPEPVDAAPAPPDLSAEANVKPAKAEPKPVRKPATRIAPAAKPAPARPAPAAKRPAARTASPAAAPKGNSKLFLILGGVAAVVVVAVVAIALSGKKEPSHEVAKKQDVAAEVEVKPAKSEPKLEIKPEPKPEPKVEVKAPPPPPPPLEAPPKAAQNDARKEFEERMAERKKEARAHLEEVTRELAAERKDAEQLAEATRKRLAAQKVSLSLTSGETYKDAVIENFTFHGADLQATGKKVRITWDTVQPPSLVAAAEVLYDPKQPGDLFERGRFFVARRMWKDAQAAFASAAKLGGGYESRVLEFSEVLDRLVSGQGGFRGSARRIGRDGVRLAWDFHDPKQLEDFTGGLTLSGKAVQLETARKAAVFLFGGTSSGSGDSPLAFRGEVSVEMKLGSDGPVTFHLFTGDLGGGYELDLGPAGASLFKIDPKAAEKDRRKTLAKSDKVKLAAGKTAEVRLTVRFPRFLVTVDGAEALSAEDGPVSVTADPPKGPFGFGIEKGKLRIEAPFAVQGRAEAGELDRRINDTEVMVRRALDPDLEQIERFRARRKAMSLLGEARDLSFSSDDPWFAFRIKKFEDITKYEDLKKNIGGIPDKQTPEQWKAEMDALIAKYPDVPSLYHVRAIFKHAYQDYFGALADVKKAVEIFPEFHEALELHAQMLLEMQDGESALAEIRKAIEARPDYVEGYVTRARCVFATTGSMQAFMEDLDIARRLDPQDSTAVQVQRMLKYQRLGPRELGCRFDYETPHYKVTTDISAEAAKKYGDNLEAAFRHFVGSFKGMSARLGKKPRVAIFNTAENYYTYFELLSEDRGEHTAGVFRGALNELVLFENGDVTDTNHTLYHEAVHQFMTLLTNRTPPFWYNEGIAEYMGSIKVQDGKVLEKGVVLKGRLPYIQLGIEVKADMPFEKIMNETPREFYSGNVGLKYAQAWSMIHFFYEHEKGKYRGLIEDYFESLRAGKTPRDCFDSVFKAKAETLEKEWREFTRALKP